jgi:hypothetical protein
VTLPSPGRDGSEVEALITDRYLDSLLALPAPTSVGNLPVGPDDGLRGVAERLARLPRLHPSFRFEEALSARLTAAALARRLPAAAGAEGTVIALPRVAGAEADAVDPALAAYLDGVPIDEDDTALVRPLIIGSALTSAALSLAGAAFVEWRLRRPVGNPMTRAVRAVARTRLT